MSEDWQTQRAQRLRTLIMSADGEMVEERKWRKPTNPEGVPTFSCAGLVCTLETYQDKVKLTFAKGASVEDPTGIFNASMDAGTRRAVDLREADGLDEAAFVALVRSAVARNRD